MSRALRARAPDHSQTREPRALLERVQHAGSVFLGSWSPEPMGDYCSGTNHVLPTYGYARAYSGLSVHDFTRRITVQELSAARASRRSAPPPARWHGSRASTPTPRRSSCGSRPCAGSAPRELAHRDRTAGNPGAEGLRARGVGAGPDPPACERAAVARPGRLLDRRPQPLSRAASARADRGAGAFLRRRPGHAARRPRQ